MPEMQKDDQKDAELFRLACELEIDITHRVVDGPRVLALPPGGPYCGEFYNQADERIDAMRLAVSRSIVSARERKLRLKAKP